MGSYNSLSYKFIKEKLKRTMYSIKKLRQQIKDSNKNSKLIMKCSKINLFSFIVLYLHIFFKWIGLSVGLQNA